MRRQWRRAARFPATAIEKKIAETPANAKRSTNKRNVIIQYRTSHQLTTFCARALAAAFGRSCWAGIGSTKKKPRRATGLKASRGARGFNRPHPFMFAGQHVRIGAEATFAANAAGGDAVAITATRWRTRSAASCGIDRAARQPSEIRTQRSRRRRIRSP
jgi:hypothetical protein